MTPDTGGKPPKKKFPVARMMRGLLVVAALVVVAVYATRAIVALWLASAGGMVEISEDRSLPWIVGLIAIAMATWSRRISGVAFKAGSRIALKFRLVYRRDRRTSIEPPGFGRQVEPERWRRQDSVVDATDNEGEGDDQA